MGLTLFDENRFLLDAFYTLDNSYEMPTKVVDTRYSMNAHTMQISESALLIRSRNGISEIGIGSRKAPLLPKLIF